MGMTVTNINTLQLLNIVGKTQDRQTDVITQLSTGLRINKGSDDPAGLIALKSLESELTAVDASIANNQRTDAVLGVADTAMGEIHGLLQEVQSLIVASSSDANLSASEISANQSQIDLAIQSIDRIARTTEFNGRRLIDGTGAIQTSVTSADAIQDLKVFSRGNLTSNLTLSVDVTTDAAEASHSFGVFSTGATGGADNGTSEIAVTGNLGTATLELSSGLTAAQTATQINAAKDSTGVSAIVSGSGSATTVFLTSLTQGTDAFVTVDILNGVTDLSSAGSLSTSSGKVSGADAAGTINGQNFNADGSQVSFNIGGVSGSFEIGSAYSASDPATTFAVETTGGFTFQLGSSADTRVTVGIDALFAHKLGSSSKGYLNTLQSGGSADLGTAASRAAALNIVEESVNQVAVANGRLGGFQKFQVQTAISSLQATKTGLADAKSIIADTDYAIATAELNKQSVLLNSGISLLGLANQQASQILSLLG
jgi:flagellin